MNPRRRRWATATLAAIALLATRTATADSHRVAAVDPDDQLVHALEIALSPWGATVLAVHIETPGATMPMAVDRARDIARDARVDVLVWVSASDAGHALWIYDVASDHASARELEIPPPFEPADAAAVALAVKTLLRGTVIAPAAERFGAELSEPSWLIGAVVGVSAKTSRQGLVEARVGVHASVWPAAFGHRWGLSVDLDGGPGAGTVTSAFSGTLSDTALRLGVGLRVPLVDGMALEPSLGASAHDLNLDGVVRADASHVAVRRLDAAFEPRAALTFALLGGRLLLAPWVGLTAFARWQRFLVHGDPVLESGPVGLEGALRMALALP